MANPAKKMAADPAAEPLTQAEIDQGLQRGLEWLERSQAEDGSWHGDYGGPLFLLPLFVGTADIVGYELDDGQRERMRDYLLGQQNSDGGFGLDVEGHSHMFTTTLNYAALRKLGCNASDSQLRSARRWIHRHGGPQAAAPWGKFALALMNLYEWEGLDPLMPELWLLPQKLPIHPSRLWCHCRMVYLPMAYLYGRRFKAPLDALTQSLRQELYETPYEQIDWNVARGTVAISDVYRPLSPAMRQFNKILLKAEQNVPAAIRQRALDFIVDQVRQEDENTGYICIGPINKLYNTLVWHDRAPGGREVRRHLERLGDYLYEAKDGLKMQGYNNSRLWDTTFAIQAIVASEAGRKRDAMLAKAHGYLESNQVLEDTPQMAKYFRHASKGGWPFSNRQHGWPISDCTAEGLKSALVLGDMVDKPIEDSRLEDAAKLILSWQNADGGFPTYELKRGPDWLEFLNPALVFDNIMVDYSYVECTSACVQALVAFRDARPERFPREGHAALKRAERYLRKMQRPDGSWEGSWGVCFTYGTWFGVWGLRALGASPGDPAIASAADFLIQKQRSDGAWGETVESCRQRRYVEAEQGQAVMTSWALLTLMKAGLREHVSVRQGMRWLLEHQHEDGSMPDEHIAGVFNRTCAIHYDNYLKVFPVWALALYRQ